MMFWSWQIISTIILNNNKKEKEKWGLPRITLYHTGDRSVPSQRFDHSSEC